MEALKREKGGQASELLSSPGSPAGRSGSERAEDKDEGCLCVLRRQWDPGPGNEPKGGCPGRAEEPRPQSVGSQTFGAGSQGAPGSGRRAGTRTPPRRAHPRVKATARRRRPAGQGEASSSQRRLRHPSQTESRLGWVDGQHFCGPALCGQHGQGAGAGPGRLRGRSGRRAS